MAVNQATDQTPVASALYGVGTQNSPDIDTTGCSMLNVFIDMTAVGSSGTLVVTIQGKDAASGKYYDILASASIATNTTTRMKVGPNITASANVIAQDYLPKTIRLKQVIGTAGSTYSIGVSLTG